MGWKQGEGIGKNPGVSENIYIEKRKDVRGLGCEDSSNAWLGPTNSFTSILSKLNNHTNINIDSSSTLAKQSSLTNAYVIPRSSHLKKLKAHNPSNMTSDDMDILFGRVSKSPSPSLSPSPSPSPSSSETLHIPSPIPFYTIQNNNTEKEKEKKLKKKKKNEESLKKNIEIKNIGEEISERKYSEKFQKQKEKKVKKKDGNKDDKREKTENLVKEIKLYKKKRKRGEGEEKKN